MISKTCGYAIRGVLYLAMDDNLGKKIGIVKIAEDLGIPKHFLGKVLQALVRKGLVFSVKGPHGGFYVGNEALEMPISCIIEATDGFSSINSCLLGLEHCSNVNPCPMHFEFEKCRSAIHKTFENKNVRDLLENVAEGRTFLQYNV